MPTTNRSRSVAVLCLLLLALAFSLPSAMAQSAGSPNLVISQAYGGGGNSGATYTNDFIEIFNRGTAPVDLSNYSVQYASSSGTSWQVTKLTGTIQPGQYYLVQESAGSGGSTPLPTADVTGTIAMGASGFKVALVASQTALSGACPLTSVVDFLGANSTGTSGCSEGTPTGSLSNTTAALRKGNGCVDTDVNASDFEILAPAPRNSVTALQPCSGGTTPTNPSGIGLATPNSVDINGTTVLTVAVTPGTNPASDGLTVGADLSPIGGSTTQSLYDDGTHGDVTAGDNTFSYAATVAGGTTAGIKNLAVTIADTQLRTASTSISLTVTAPATAYPIHQIRTNASSLLGAFVETSGIVTGLRSNGFYLQEKDGTFDGTTSLAIYVYTGSTIPTQAVIGNELDITGTVAQYPTGVTPTELELSGVTIKSVLGTGEPLPTAIDLVPDGTEAQPAQFEKYAGMLVHVNAPNVVGPTSSSAFYITAANVSRPFREPGVEVGLTLPDGAGAAVPRYDGNPEVLRVDMSGCQNQANLAVGDATGDLTGPLGYYYSSTYGGAYSLYTCVTGTTSRTATPVSDRGTDEFTVASFNMYNFAGSATQTAKAALEIRDIMKMPDVIGVEEVKDLASLQKVADAVNSAAPAGVTPNYQAQMGAISGSQNVGFLYRGDRVSNPTFTVLGNTGNMSGTCTNFTVWDRQPFQMDAAFTTSEDKLFPVTIVVNHLRSLIDVESNDNSGYCARWKRQLEAEGLAQMLAGLQQQGKHVIALGDFNAFDFNDGYVDVMGTVTGNPAPTSEVVLPTTDYVDPNLTDLVKSWPDKAIYTYVENGSAQSIDHIVANNALLTHPYRVEVAHANADFPTAFSSNATRPERVSDHDQPVAYFTLPSTSPDISVSTTTLDFGAVLITSSSAAKTITVTNSGTDTLNISQVTVTGDFTESNDCTTVAPGAACTVSVTFAPKLSGTRTGSVTITHDAAGSPTTVTLTGVATDFTLTAGPGGSLSAGVTPGQTATYTLQVAGSTGFSGAVSFACLGAPEKATCTVSPGSANLSGTTPIAVTVKVATAGSASAAGIQAPSTPHSGLPLPLVVSMMAAAVLIMLSNRKLRLRIGAACASLLLLIALNGCGNSKPPQPTTAGGTYPVTITATSGNVSHTINLTLVVVSGR